MQSATRQGTRVANTLVNSTTNISRASALRQIGFWPSWICAECRADVSIRPRRTIQDSAPASRCLSSSTIRRVQEEQANEKSRTDRTATAASSRNPPDSLASNVATVLPSHAAKRRSEFSARMTRLMDGVLARASIAGQHINVYTGTDYSGIETLRHDIIEQEQRVKGYHTVLEDAKAAYQNEFAKQAASQKEIVALLERKSNWTPTDLERYMSLVRSEHVNEQAVQAAKNSLDGAETKLEDARSLLERLERKQYHEEQVWSDTIRRNSTWVTFGLMGVNIVLLLAQILIFEPYRRKKIVRDMKAVLDEKTLPSAQVVEVARQTDGLVSPAGGPVEAVERSMEKQNGLEQTQASQLHLTEKQPVDEILLAPGRVLPRDSSHIPQKGPSTVGNDMLPPSRRLGTWNAYTEAFHDLFSGRMVQMQKVELTTAVLQGVATGVAATATATMFLVWRSK